MALYTEKPSHTVQCPTESHHCGTTQFSIGRDQLNNYFITLIAIHFMIYMEKIHMMEYSATIF
jgi:hypothetical protein